MRETLNELTKALAPSARKAGLTTAVAAVGLGAVAVVGGPFVALAGVGLLAGYAGARVARKEKMARAQKKRAEAMKAAPSTPVEN